MREAALAAQLDAVQTMLGSLDKRIMKQHRAMKRAGDLRLFRGLGSSARTRLRRLCRIRWFFVQGVISRLGSGWCRDRTRLAASRSSGRRSANAIDDTAELRNIVGAPNPGSVNKEMPGLDELSRRFIALSPILFVSTVGVDGRADVSPRGDVPGFVKVLDDGTIALPDRPGNRRVDTMSNIGGNPSGSVGLMFLVPGIDEVMRASGCATISRDPKLLGEMAVNGKQLKLAIVIAAA